MTIYNDNNYSDHVRYDVKNNLHFMTIYNDNNYSDVMRNLNLKHDLSDVFNMKMPVFINRNHKFAESIGYYYQRFYIEELNQSPANYVWCFGLHNVDV